MHNIGVSISLKHQLTEHSRKPTRKKICLASESDLSKLGIFSLSLLTLSLQNCIFIRFRKTSASLERRIFQKSTIFWLPAIISLVHSLFRHVPFSYHQRVLRHSGASGQFTKSVRAHDNSTKKDLTVEGTSKNPSSRKATKLYTELFRYSLTLFLLASNFKRGGGRVIS